MAIWKDHTVAKTTPLSTTPDLPRTDLLRKEPDVRPDLSASLETARTVEPPRRALGTKESLIAEGLTIEGKIEGTGDVRIAGRFQGDVHVQGDLTIETGAKLTGGVRASTVTIGGELEGNIDAASRVELLQTGVLNGNLKAGSLTVAAGSRMRGQVEFGWEERALVQPLTAKTENGSAP